MEQCREAIGLGVQQASSPSSEKGDCRIFARRAVGP